MSLDTVLLYLQRLVSLEGEVLDFYQIHSLATFPNPTEFFSLNMKKCHDMSVSRRSCFRRFVVFTLSGHLIETMKTSTDLTQII